MKSIDKLCRLLWWIIQNWRIITWSKIRNFLQAKYRKSTSGYKDWVVEQFEWRQSLVAEKSPACILGGACVNCGCDTPDKFYETDACEVGCYPEWMDKETWEEFKKSNTAGK
jgi:hypothetical protein